MTPGDELVEWIDESGAVIDVVTRRRMRAEHLRHRSVYVVVISTDGRRLVVHKRADWKDVNPGLWDLAFGGVCGVGESWIESAQRELMEEAGIDLPVEAFRDLGSGAYEEPGQVSLLARIFAVSTDGPVTPQDGEVSEVRWLPLSDSEVFLAEHCIPSDSIALVVPVLKQLTG